jgi:SAM-dependent methyltransferase
VELIEHNIEVFRQKLQLEDKITITQGNALDLSMFSDATYNITLLLGPLYHVYNHDDKHKIISEALRITKRGGIIYAAHLTADSTILEGGFRNNRFNVKDFIEKGLLDGETFVARSEPEYLFEIVRKENIDELMVDFNTTRLHYVSADCYANHMKEAINNMDEETFNLYLKYHFTICERSDMVGLSHHVLDIFRKE